MKRNSLLLLALVALLGNAASAKDQVFNNVVHHIESHYHVHRQGGFIMGFAGLVVKCSHVAGVKSFKAAIFENQQFVNTESDTQFDQVVRGALDKGWQPVVQSFSHRTGERTYIYAQYIGKDMKLLLVTLESNEAVIMQVQLNPNKMMEFVDENSHGSHQRHTAQAPGNEEMAAEIMTDLSF
jgi:hypothetical protein